jgi:L,D-peptidoglycan transpeptidase YkuD (ErfK/YbiS/YcfS/YnhG family)
VLTASARLGSAGIGVASEGSTRTPQGTWALTEGFGRLGNPGTALPYRVVDGDDWWVGDTRSPRYNEYAQCARRTCPFSEPASENLYDIGPVYDNAVVIDYNRPGVPGAGSAFFLHIANSSPTGGCVAVDRGSMTTLLRWLRPDAAPVISIGLG